MPYRVESLDGKDVLCTYKQEPDDRFPVTSFMGADAAALVCGDMPSDPRIVTFKSFSAAARSAFIYGGRVQHVPAPGSLGELLEPVRSVNGGW